MALQASKQATEARHQESILRGGVNHFTWSPDFLFVGPEMLEYSKIIKVVGPDQPVQATAHYAIHRARLQLTENLLKVGLTPHLGAGFDHLHHPRYGEAMHGGGVLNVSPLPVNTRSALLGLLLAG